MSDEVDEELLLVAALGVALRMIRQKLDDTAAQRAIMYCLERAGVHVSTQLHIGPSPFPGEEQAHE
jgi:hypothetical protein